jgi:hypothetical protein
MPPAVRYWHGGAPGLRAGDRILPPDTTGTAYTLIAYARQVAAAAGFDCAQRTDRVYLTTDREDAKVYAFLYPRGSLYRVQPDDPLEPDLDCTVPGLSWQAPGATVLAVYDACVTESRRVGGLIIPTRPGPSAPVRAAR